MAAQSLGTLTLDLIAKIGGFVGPIDKAARQTEVSMKQIKVSTIAAGVALGEMAAKAITSVPGMMEKLITGAADSAQEISNLSRVAGLSTTEFQKLAAGSSTVGVSSEKLSDILKDVNDKVGDFLNTGGGPLQDFFTNIAPKVGVTADQFRKLNSADALQLYVSSLQKANASQNEMTFYMEAIANDATGLLPLLRNNGSAWKELGDQAEAAGAILSGDTIVAAKQFNAQLNQLGQYVDAAKTSIAAEFLPVVAQFTTDLNSAIKSAGGLGSVTKKAGEAVVEGGAAIANVGDGIRGAFSIIANLVVGLYSTAAGHIDQLAADANKALGFITFGDTSKQFKANAAELANDAQIQFGIAAQAAGKIKEEIESPLAGDVFKKYVADAKSSSKEVERLFGDQGTTGTGTGIDATAAKKAADAAKQAAAAQKKIDDAYKSTATDIQRQIDLINTSTDATKDATQADKLRFEIASGKLVGINAEQQKRLLSLADELDALEKLKKSNEDLAKVESYIATLRQENDTAKSGLDMELAGVGLGEKTRDRMREMLQIQETYNQKMADLQDRFQSKDISKEVYERDTAALNDALNKRLANQQDYYRKQDDQLGDWIAGAKDAWADYSDSAKDLSGQMYDVTSNALSSLQDELVSFAKTGKFNFSEFAEGIADDLLNMLVKVGLQMAVNAAIGDTAAAGSAALAAATGTAMAAAYAPAAAMASLASFGANAAPASAAITSTTALASSLSLLGMAHDGIDAIPETGTWLLQKGERVTTAATSAKLDRTLSDLQYSAGGSASADSPSTPAIQQHISVQGSADEATLSRIQEAAKQGAQLGYQMVLKDFRSNGPARRQLRSGG